MKPLTTSLEIVAGILQRNSRDSGDLENLVFPRLPVLLPFSRRFRWIGWDRPISRVGALPTVTSHRRVEGVFSIERFFIRLSTAMVLLTPIITVAADSEEIAELKQMIHNMRSDYERRIQELEQRVERAELAAADSRGTSSAGAGSPGPVDSPPKTAESVAVRGTVSSGNAFNPQTSVILNGNFYHDDVDGEGVELTSAVLQPSQPGHEHDGHAHGGATNGFNFSEAELAFSASVDPYFDAVTYLAIDDEGNTDLEEAWFQTRSLPYGLKLKGGRFLSDFGYINNQHPHQWDFTDQNLAYLNLLGDHGLQDTGVQLTWLPDSPVYALFGMELLQGKQERLGSFVDDTQEREELGLDSRKDGPRLWTAIVKISPDLGYDHALQLGTSYAHGKQQQEVHQYQYSGSAELFEVGLEGDADLWGLDAVYKYDDSAPYGHRDFKLQTEYLHSVKKLEVTGGDLDAIGSMRKFTTDGFYIQVLYGVAPRWQAGVRYDVLGLTNKITGDASQSFDSSDRWTFALTWLPTEFSLLRLQYEYSDILSEPGQSEKFNTVWLQFLMSMGSHGAHRF